MAVAQRHGKRIRGIEILWRGFQPENVSDHETDLLLRSRSASNDRTLHFAGRILCSWNLCIDGGQDRYTSGVAEFHGRLSVFAVERRLDGELVGVIALDDPAEGGVDGLQPERHGLVAPIFYDIHSQELECTVLLFNDSITGDKCAGINAEYDHGCTESPRIQGSENTFVDVKVAVDMLRIIVFFEGFDEFDQVLSVLPVDLDDVFGNHLELCVLDRD